jgi:hypothetical protein
VFPSENQSPQIIVADFVTTGGRGLRNITNGVGLDGINFVSHLTRVDS